MIGQWYLPRGARVDILKCVGNLSLRAFGKKWGKGRGWWRKIVLKPKIIMNLLGQNFGLRKPQFCISGNWVYGKSYHKKFGSRFCGESCDKKLGMCAFCFPNIKRQDVRVNQNQVISVCLLLLKTGSCAHPTMDSNQYALNRVASAVTIVGDVAFRKQTIVNGICIWQRYAIRTCQTCMQTHLKVAFRKINRFPSNLEDEGEIKRKFTSSSAVERKWDVNGMWNRARSLHKCFVVM